MTEAQEPVVWPRNSFLTTLQYCEQHAICNCYWNRWNSCLIKLERSSNRCTPAMVKREREKNRVILIECNEIIWSVRPMINRGKRIQLRLRTHRKTHNWNAHNKWFVDSLTFHDYSILVRFLAFHSTAVTMWPGNRTAMTSVGCPSKHSSCGLFIAALRYLILW